MVKDVEISRFAAKQLQKTPRHVVDKLLGWVRLVEQEGLDEARKISGYHDEGLLGKRKNQRSIRLSKAYRAIYCLSERGSVEFVKVEEVNKHDY